MTKYTMRNLIALIEKAQAEPRTAESLSDYDGDALKDGCTKKLPPEIAFADFAFVWWVGGTKAEMKAKHEAFIALEKDMTQETIPHADMVTGQVCVNPDKVQSLIDNPTTKRPVIQRWNGNDILFDGNHRVTADVLSGKTETKCLVMHCDEKFDQDGNLK